MNVLMSILRRFRPSRSPRAQEPSGQVPVTLFFEIPAISVARLVQTMLWVMVGGAMVLAAWISHETLQLDEEAARYERAAQRLQAQNGQFADLLRREGLRVTPQQLMDLKREVTFANQLSEKHDFSWSRLLSALEEVLPSRVSLVSIQMDARESMVTLQGVAASHREVTDLVAHLVQHAAFHKPTLSNHHVASRVTAVPVSPMAGSSDVQERGRVPRVEFTLNVLYRPLL